MSYIAALHRPSSVRHAVCADVLVPGQPALVLARPSALDVFQITAQGLVLARTAPVAATVSALLAFKPARAATSWLFVATEDGACFTLVIDDNAAGFVTMQVLDAIDDRFAPDIDTDHIAVLDPQYRGILLHINKGSLVYVPLIPVKKRQGKQPALPSAPVVTGTLHPPINLHLEELLVLSIVFLENTKRPTIAVLYRDGQHARHVKIYEIFAQEGRLEEVPNAGLRNVDQGASVLLPFRPPAGGCFLLGEQLLTYFPSPSSTGGSKPIKLPFEHGPIGFCAYAAIDDTGERYVLGDDLGRTYILQVDLATDPDDGEVSVESWKLDHVGDTAIPTSMTYLGSGFFFVTSHFSPSTLFYLSPDAPHLRVVQTIPNLAPISDFRLLYRDSTTDVIACSGAFKSGSIRIVRSGVGVDVLAEINDMPGVTGLWTYHDIIIASFVESTLVLRCDIDEGTSDAIQAWCGIDMTEPTIGFGSLGAHVVHVTPSGARLVDAGAQQLISVFNESPISAAAVTDDCIVLVVAGTKLATLDWEFTVVSVVTLDHEISCVAAHEDICVAGLWTECRVHLFTLPNLTPIGESTELTGSIPRSVQIATLDTLSRPVLFVGMADGTLYSYTLGANVAMDGTLLDQKITNLGTQPVALYGLKSAVFAVSSYSTMIYGATSKITMSTVNIPSPSALATTSDALLMDGDEMDGSSSNEILVYAYDGKIFYGAIDQLMSTHVQTIEIGETARRLSLLTKRPEIVAFVSLNTTLDPYNGDEILNCSVKLADYSTFEVTDSYALNENEMVESIATAELDGQDYVIVGTGMVVADREEYLNGRLLMFEVTPENKLSLDLEHQFHGGVYALEMLSNGIIICAVNALVRLCTIRPNRVTGVLEFNLYCAFRSPTIALSLSSYADKYVLVGDLMKAAALLQIRKDADGNFTFVEIARHYEPLWMTDVEVLDESTSLGAEAEGNIVVFQHDATDGPQGELVKDTGGEGKLQVISSMQLGNVNRIRRIESPADASEHAIIPQAYLATRDGGIYLYAKIASDKIDVLLNLQQNLATVVKTLGARDFLQYRAFANQRRRNKEPLRFVDGDFLEQFLELSDDDKELVVSGGSSRGNSSGIGRQMPLGMTSSEVSGMLEDLKRLH
ncbi:CPSF A subunit region-domain-containing protein [Limtongia smithiae]|uniref:CPSF A subunit region-domain-containing protein n=1 Tax=Limtongia smithiae TaxID=1125753 RepID=UPI0034CD1C2C